MNHATTAAISTSRAGIWPVLIVAVLTWLRIVTSLDPGGSYPSLGEGPGLTVDEIFNVEQGVYLVEQARALGWYNLFPGTSQEAYRPVNGYLPDHPPLGRWWLGLFHHLTWSLIAPLDPEGMVVTACARTGSATAFALTVLLVGWFASACSGRAVGIMTALSLVMMPRVYGHAHLASLETITNLTCTAAVLAVAAWWNGPAPPTRRDSILAGVFLGLALITKIQAVLIPIPIIAWTLWRWRANAFVPLVLWSGTGVIVFFIMWPYLWFDPIGHCLEYLGRTTNRATIHVWYFGHKYADKEVPWHYPFVMFGLTVPIVLHGLGLLGLLASWHCDTSHLVPSRNGDNSKSAITESTASARFEAGNHDLNRDVLLIGCVLFPLVVFAIPGVAVYDGERLFLTVFPIWAFFIGRGWIWFWQFVVQLTRSSPTASLTCSAVMLLAASPLLTMSPCHLSYYNGLTAVLGAQNDPSKSLEIDYWGVGITRNLIKQLVQSVPEGATVAVIPTLHQFQADEYRRQSPILRAHGVKTVEYHPHSSNAQYVLVFCRRADLPESWSFNVSDRAEGKIMRGGHTLAYFINRDELNASPNE